MITLEVDFSKRTELDKLFFSKEQAKRLRIGQKIRMTDNDIAVVGLILSDYGRLFAQIDWNTTEYNAKGKYDKQTSKEVSETNKPQTGKKSG